MRLLFSIIFFCISVHLVAQTENVVYQDEPLSSVIKDLETKFSVRFSYNSAIVQGKTFTYSGAISLKDIIKLIGIQNNLAFNFFDEKNLIIKKAMPDDEFILNYVTDLDEVLILSEYLTSGFDKNKDNGSITLSPDKLGILPGLTEPDILQSLQLLPGISSPGESASDIHIRGGTPDQNLVLWDGVKMYHQGHFFGMISAFNPYVTERVNVYRSGTSAKYGDRISGVIDIESSNKIPEKVECGIGANLIQADAFMKIPVAKKLAFTFSARRSYSDLINSVTFQKISDKIFQNTKVEGVDRTGFYNFQPLRNKFYFNDYNLKTVWKPDTKNTFSISTLFVSNKLDFASKVVDLDFDTKDKLDLKNDGASFSWDHIFSQKLNMNFSAYVSNYESIYEYQEFFAPGELYTSSNINNIDDKGFSLTFDYKHSDKHSWVIGYDLVNNNVAYDLQYGYSTQVVSERNNSFLNSNSVFLEHQYKSNKLLLRYGLRSSFLSKNINNFFEPRLYLNYDLNTLWKLKASAEIKNQVISRLLSFEFNDLGLGDNIWALADNDRVPVLNNRQVSGGFLFRKKGWKLDVDVFYKKIKGLNSLTKGFNASSTTESYARGESQTYGVDVLLKKQIKNFRTWLSYSLSKTDFRFPSLSARSFAGNFDQRHVLSFSNTYKYKKFNFSLGWHFATGKPYTESRGLVDILDENNVIIDQVIGYKEQNAARLKNYHRLDASIFYNFYYNKKQKVKSRVGISVLNIYNHSNEIDKTYRLDRKLFDPNGADPEVIEQTRFGLGLTPNLVFRLNF